VLRRETAMLWRIRTCRPARTQSDSAPITRRSYDQPARGHTPWDVPEEVDMSGINPHDLAESDLIRELAHLHRTRHDTFLHGSPDALREHSSRLAELEGEYLRRHPEREVDPARTRLGARGEASS